MGGLKGHIQIYSDPGGMNPVPLFNQTWDVSELPVTLYVEGVVVSSAPRDIEFRATYNGPGGPCEDVVKLTVVEVDMDADANNDGLIDPTNGLAGADDSIEKQSPGKIICIDASISVPINLSEKPALSVGTATLSGGGTSLAVFSDAALTTQIPLPVSWPVGVLPPAVYVQGLSPGSTELQLSITHGGTQCVDQVALTIRPRWTADLFPQMVFNVSNDGTTIGPNTPAPVSEPQVGFGGPGTPTAIAWDPIITVQSNGAHVSCDQFTVGVVQNMLAFGSTYTFASGSIEISKPPVPALDQALPYPPKPFYSTGAMQVLSNCGDANTIHFEDTPGLRAAAWINLCPGPGNGSALTAIEFADSLETWLVALHNPSGCHTVLRHFTWSQQAQTTSVDVRTQQITATVSTAASAIDAIAGTTPKLDGTPFNSNGIQVLCNP